MKITLCFLAGALLLVGTASLSAQATRVPGEMNYQGYLVDAAGNPVAANAPEDLRLAFRLYNAPTGGNVLWGEEQIVTVFQGNISAILGNGSDLGDGTPSGPGGLSNVFAGTSGGDGFYLEISRDGTAYTPRQRILPGALAHRAKIAERVLPGGLNGANLSGAVGFDNQEGMKLHFFNQSGNHFGYGLGGNLLWERVGPGGSFGWYRGGEDPDIGGASQLMRLDGGGLDLNAGSIDFGANTRQMINLNNANYGIGVQPNTLYLRTGGNFGFYRNGTHWESPLDAGNGQLQAYIDERGNIGARGEIQFGNPNIGSVIGDRVYGLVRAQPGSGSVPLAVDVGVVSVPAGSIWFARFDGFGWAISSDRRLKSDIVKIDDVLERMLAVEFCSFTRNDAVGDSRKIGVIAQQVQPLFPEVVLDRGDGPEGEDNYLMVREGDFGYLAGRALQEFHAEQTATNTELRAQIDAQAARIAELEAALAAEIKRSGQQAAALEERLSRLESIQVSHVVE